MSVDESGKSEERSDRSSTRYVRFWVLWVGLVAFTIVVSGLLSPFLGLNVIGSMLGWQPSSERGTYAAAVLDALVLALPPGLIALALLRRRTGALDTRSQLSAVGAFMLSAALASLGLVVVTLGWYSLVVHGAGLFTGSFRLDATALYVAFCVLGPLMIVIACIILVRIPVRHTRS